MSIKKSQAKVHRFQKFKRLKENRVFTFKKYVIDPSHPSWTSNSLYGKGFSPLKSRRSV